MDNHTEETIKRLEARIYALEMRLAKVEDSEDPVMQHVRMGPVHNPWLNPPGSQLAEDEIIPREMR